MLRKIHIEKISHVLTSVLAATGAIAVPQEQISMRIQAVITQNMEAERALDDEAHKLLDKHRNTMGSEMDEQKAFMMIKRQLAKQKGFIL